MSTAKPRSVSKKVKIQNGWIWGGILKEENKPTHFGFSHSWECMQSWLLITIPPKPACAPGASLLHQGTCAVAEERLGGVRELLFTVTTQTRGCAVAFSHQVWLVSAMLVAIHAFFFFFLDTDFELHFIFLLQFSWQMTVQSRPPLTPSLFLFLLDLSHYWGFNQGFDRHLQSNLFPYSAWDQL